MVLQSRNKQTGIAMITLKHCDERAMHTDTMTKLKRILLLALISSATFGLMSCEQPVLRLDSDADGIGNDEELADGTDLNDPDSDDDGYDDLEEWNDGTDPNDPDDFPWESEAVKVEVQPALFRAADGEVEPVIDERQNGHRSLTSLEPHVEFFVNGDSQLQITFLNERAQLATMAEDPVSVYIGKSTDPTRLTFTRKANILRSTAALPDGDGYALTVQYHGETPLNFTDVLPPLKKWNPEPRTRVD
jgi:hypothetical protein